MQLQIFSRFQRLFRFGAHPEDTYQQKLWEGLQIGLQERRPWLFPKNTKRKIQSQREDWDGMLNPLRKEDIPMLPQQFQLTKNGEQFFLRGSGLGDEQRIFVFATQQGIYLLGENEHWFMDDFFLRSALQYFIKSTQYVLIWMAKFSLCIWTLTK